MAEEAEVELQPGTSPEVETTEKDVPATTETASSETETKPEKTLTQSEVDEIVQKRLAKERRKLEREIRLEAENEALKKQAQPKEEPKTGKPTPDKYSTYEDYLEALAKHTVTEERQKQKQESEQEKQKQTRQEKLQGYNERAKEARKSLPDFDDVVDQDLPVSQVMIETITESEIGPHIAYHLGKNPDEAERIANLPPLAAARAIGKIEAMLESKLTPTEPAQQSNAPKPVTPVKGTKSVVEKDPADMTDKEFAEWRKRQIAQRK